MRIAYVAVTIVVALANGSAAALNWKYAWGKISVS
jgi:hypothetical protein